MEGSLLHSKGGRRSLLLKRRALVVDDVEDCAASLALFLQLEGYETHVGHDGAEAVELARQLQPAIIFMDLGMPAMDGFEAARHIRQQPGGEQIVICALSAYDARVCEGHACETDFDYRLLKPVDFEEIASVLLHSVEVAARNH